MNIHRILCFGRNDESGNAALVVEQAQLDEVQRLAFAQKQGANATVFVEEDAAGGRVLDYYYPHTRSPLCLHATLAASALLFERNPDSGRIRCVTSMRRQSLEIERIDGTLFVTLQAQPCPSLAGTVDDVAGLLRIRPMELIGRPRLASVGSAKLLVEVADRPTLDALRPDLAGIGNWGRQHGVSGIYAYCRLDDDVYAGRNFNHLEPRFEDPATGVAAGALALSLERNMTLLQGDALGKPCTLQARYTNGVVQVGGRAVRATG
ncbi:PhzF family phenazine biosynthesis protein [Burkholderia sp. Ax-1719]|uniref:PhzF family phenazine biosynthesis protein n=1 Tax=Burkholderia sp. Ax-1719 TaxID=2608334 RepID=UPI001420FB64|nr:PhzF family phenazine biosynthesis protein [Burkholderia sp. Ax-1719]NIE63442.1 PhzF family phenazine biosynthesis protein [Burkholderia sp. Ax-1719]